MDLEAQSIGALIVASAALIPIVGALWKLFAMREQLQAGIVANQHRIDLLEQNIAHLADQQELFLNGLKETLGHVRARTQHAEQLLDSRLSDLEGFIEKTTAFTKRQRN
jgi:Tfp pilus assembly protein PilN